MSDRGKKLLVKALKGKITDDFDEGDVLRWVSSGRFTYAAIKTSVGWFSTARYGNSYVPQIMTFSELVVVLQRAETTFVEFAGPEGWELLG